MRIVGADLRVCRTDDHVGAPLAAPCLCHQEKGAASSAPTHRIEQEEFHSVHRIQLFESLLVSAG